MTLSPKKYVSNFTSSTTNRGVEAKEIEIANTCLDVRACCRAPDPAPARSPPDGVHTHHDEPDDTASYIQVEVRRARRSRLPAASSPAPAAALAAPAVPTALKAVRTLCAAPVPEMQAMRERAEAARGEDGAKRGAGLVAETCAGASPTSERGRCRSGGSGGGGQCAGGDACASAGAADTRHAASTAPADDSSEKHRGVSIWKKFGGYAASVAGDDNGAFAGLVGGESTAGGDGPERVEVYYFETGRGAWLATSGGACEAAVERAARRAARRGARRLLEEVCAGAVVAWGAPLAVAVAAERAALVCARAAAVGAVQTAADYALKPALTLVFNAALHPPLVFAGNVARAVRDALRPVWAALGDALDPLARVLAAVRLVHVHVERRCACAHAV